MNSQIQNWIEAPAATPAPMQIAILDAAAQSFTTHGFAAASIDLIANQVGATKGSVYYYYRSKADLFFAVHKRAMVMNLREQVVIASNPDASAAEKLESMAYKHAMLMMEYLYYQRVTVQGVELHQSASTTPAERTALEELVAMRDAYEGLFVNVLKQGVKSNHFAAQDCALAAKGILGMLNWITVWFRPRETDSPSFKQKIAKQFASQALKSVSA